MEKPTKSIWKLHLIWAVVAIVLAAGISRAMISKREAAFRERESELEKQIRHLKARVPAADRRAKPGELSSALGGDRSRGTSRNEAGTEATVNPAASAAKEAEKPRVKQPKLPPTPDEIRAMLTNEKRDTRRKAIELIRRMKDKPQKVALLREIMRGGDNDMKYRAVMMFDEIGKPESTQLALEVLQGGDSAWIRGRAARELSQIRDPSTMGALQNTFLENDPTLKYWSAKALQAMGWEEPVRQLVQAASPGLGDPDGAIRERTVERLGYLGGAASIEPLGQALTDPNSRVRREALQSLGNTGLPQAIPYIQKGLTDARSSVREEAIDALYDIGGQEVLPVLKSALNDADPDNVRRAQRAIERIEKKIAESGN